MVDLDDLTEYEDRTPFHFSTLPNRPQERNSSIVMQMTFEVGMTQQVILRHGYTILDLLSDMGGMYSILITFFGLLLALFNYKYFDTFMASRLFKIKKFDSEKYTRYFERSDFFQPSKLTNICLCCK